ncbi:hypothetical protein COO60DRAFT_1457170 [Scenedesmus sp. NREL 46B-D3]|nr:hypothetical protein COO60DRAFT_1457170 [Scenedesmus sp. NREL 46B-D3]
MSKPTCVGAALRNFLQAPHAVQLFWFRRCGALVRSLAYSLRDNFSKVNSQPGVAASALLSDTLGYNLRAVVKGPDSFRSESTAASSAMNIMPGLDIGQQGSITQDPDGLLQLADVAASAPAADPAPRAFAAHISASVSAFSLSLEAQYNAANGPACNTPSAALPQQSQHGQQQLAAAQPPSPLQANVDDASDIAASLLQHLALMKDPAASPARGAGFADDGMAAFMSMLSAGPPRISCSSPEQYPADEDEDWLAARQPAAGSAAAHYRNAALLAALPQSAPEASPAHGAGFAEGGMAAFMSMLSAGPPRTSCSSPEQDPADEDENRPAARQPAAGSAAAPAASAAARHSDAALLAALPQAALAASPAHGAGFAEGGLPVAAFMSKLSAQPSRSLCSSPEQGPADDDDSDYTPRYRSPSGSKSSRHASAGYDRLFGQWTAEEHTRLLAMVAYHGTQWKTIATFMPGRTSKQCRERYINNTPELNKGKWSVEEDLVLATLHSKTGNRWTIIARHLPGRSDNCVKNRWNAVHRSSCRAKNSSGLLWDYSHCLQQGLAPADALAAALALLPEADVRQLEAFAGGADQPRQPGMAHHAAAPVLQFMPPAATAAAEQQQPYLSVYQGRAQQQQQHIASRATRSSGRRRAHSNKPWQPHVPGASGSSPKHVPLSRSSMTSRHAAAPDGSAAADFYGMAAQQHDFYGRQQHMMAAQQHDFYDMQQHMMAPQQHEYYDMQQHMIAPQQHDYCDMQQHMMAPQQHEYYDMQQHMMVPQQQMAAGGLQGPLGAAAPYVVGTASQQAPWAATAAAASGNAQAAAAAVVAAAAALAAGADKHLVLDLSDSAHGQQQQQQGGRKDTGKVGGSAAATPRSAELQHPCQQQLVAASCQGCQALCWTSWAISSRSRCSCAALQRKVPAAQQDRQEELEQYLAPKLQRIAPQAGNDLAAAAATVDGAAGKTAGTHQAGLQDASAAQDVDTYAVGDKRPIGAVLPGEALSAAIAAAKRVLQDPAPWQDQATR